MDARGRAARVDCRHWGARPVRVETSKAACQDLLNALTRRLPGLFASCLAGAVSAPRGLCLAGAITQAARPRDLARARLSRLASIHLSRCAATTSVGGMASAGVGSGAVSSTPVNARMALAVRLVEALALNAAAAASVAALALAMAVSRAACALLLRAGFAASTSANRFHALVGFGGAGAGASARALRGAFAMNTDPTMSARAGGVSPAASRETTTWNRHSSVSFSVVRKNLSNSFQVVVAGISVWPLWRGMR
jgi:hypothetical protein